MRKEGLAIERSIIQLLKRFLEEQRKRKIWKKIVTFMAGIVVFCTTYALILPAITMENTLICGYEEHFHEEGCYLETGELNCGISEHGHTEDCYEKKTPQELLEEQGEPQEENSDEILLMEDEILDNEVSLEESSTTELQNSNLEEIVSEEVTSEIEETEEAAIDDLQEEELVEEEETPENRKTYQYEDDKLLVEVLLAEGTEVPEDAVLTVQTIVETDEQYDNLTAQATESVEGEVKEIILYDVSFFTASEEYLPVADTATVSFKFKENLVVEEDSEVAVLHFEEGAETPKQLETVNIEITEEEQVTAVTFETEGFSVFAVVSVANSNVNNLSGTYAIVNKQGNIAYAMSSTSQGNGLASQIVTIIDNQRVFGDSVTLWNFRRYQNNQYYISTEVNGSTYYLNIGNRSVSLSSSVQSITVTVKGDGRIMLRRSSNTNRAIDFYATDGQIFCEWDASTSNNNQLHYLYEVDAEEANILIYDLNINGDRVGDNGHQVVSSAAAWGGAIPSLTSISQTITAAETQLYTVQGNRNERNYFVNAAHLYSGGSANITASDIQHINKYLKDQGKPYGKEFRFDGWAATIDGEEYLFAENTAAVFKNGFIAVTDKTGVERLLPSGTILKGKWTEVSDVALFFVNYSGTILDTEGDVSGRNQMEFTPCVGVARIYHGKVNYGGDGVFAAEANYEIQACFSNTYDPNNPNTQVVMDYVAVSNPNNRDYRFNEAAPGINPTELADYVLQYIKNKQEVIRISTNNTNNPPIDPNNADSDHYQIRWYVMKEQTDAWHIDGVLVAKTSEMEVVKNISGLRPQQVTSMMSNTSNGFQIELDLGDDPYFNITCDPNGLPGQYTYNGRLSNDAYSYGWTFQAILNELYTMTEKNHVVDGYNCSTVTSVRTNDGVVHTAYGTSTSDVSSIGPYLKGGYAESITFNNFYTVDDTGTLAIVKRDGSMEADDKANKLKGATFELENYFTGTKLTVTTDDNGSAVFSSLEPSVYYLRETSPPDGYLQRNDEWIVNVTEAQNGEVTVTVTDSENQSTVCYQAGEVTYIYPIENTPSNHTVTVVKEFSGISDGALAELKNDTANPYMITLKSKNGFTKYDLTLNDVDVVQNNKTFTWRIIGVDAGTFEVTEKNYYHPDYTDVKVESSSGEVTLDYANKIATFDVVLNAGASDYLSIKNTYINQYGLKINKIDKDTDALLAGAQFEIYGPYQESTNTAKQISYEDSGGQIQTAYYINRLTIEDSGIGTIPNLTLSRDTKKITYVLYEVTAPSGYEPPDAPIIIENVGPGLPINLVGANHVGQYKNGILEINVPNTLKSDIRISVQATKVWDGSTGSEITLDLYRMIEGGTPLLVNGQTKTVTGSDGWKCIWTDLPAYDAADNPYIYCIREGPLNGFLPSYSNAEVIVTVDGSETVVGTTVLNDVTGLYEVTITNHSTYTLPETGGVGTNYFTVGGLALVAVSLLCGYTNRKKQRR